jgi:hypothetical protein
MSNREMIYKKLEATVCSQEDGLSAEQAKQLLGWTEEPEGEKFLPSDVHLKDISGRAIHCSNITKYQRTYSMGDVRKLMYTILSGQFELNGETISIGKHGYVLDGKTRLTSLILASQEWERNPERYPQWKQQPTIDTILVFGVFESDRVVNTIGIGKPRTIADSIYASCLFEDVTSKKDAVRLSKLLEHAIRLLWERTGAKQDAYNPRIGHCEAFFFLNNHPTLLQCARTVFLEEGGDERRLSRWLSLGYLTGLMYLMSTKGGNIVAYHQAADRSEEVLGGLPSQEKADAFIAALAAKDVALKDLFSSIESMVSQGNESPLEKMMLIIKAWNLWNEAKSVTKAALKLKTDTIEGVRAVIEDPVIDGIDVGTFSE